MELMVSLRYRLRVFVIPIDGPADVLCDNNSVTNNVTLLQLLLNRSHNAICYHIGHRGYLSWLDPR